MDATREFIDAVTRGEHHVTVEWLALLIAAHARPSLDPGATLGELDRISSSVVPGDLDSLCSVLFGVHGFVGNSVEYYDPDNSMLDQVVLRRTGIPISLSVLMIAVGRRAGVPLVGVGMPGHFLVRSVEDPALYLDPFAGGARLDEDGCRELFRRGHGADAQLLPEHLEPVGAFAIVERMLNNLWAIHRSRADVRSQLWVARLRAELPGATIVQRADVAVALADAGRFDEAAEHFDRLADGADVRSAASLRSARDRMRSLLN